MHLGEDEDIEVSGIANDSRVVLGGDVFVCIKGTSVDGHDYALDAVAAGAVAVVCSEPIPGLSEDTPQVIVEDTSAALPRLAAAFYGNPSASLTTVGVTGTNGKTTTTYLVRSILEATATACGVIGTTGYVLDDVKLTPHGGVWEPEEDDPTQERECTAPGWLAPYKGKYEVPNTTPDALQCQQLMAGMLDNGASAVAMEVSSHALAQGRVDCVDYDVAVFTNLTRDHLDFHGSMEAYREAKAELFRRLEDPERQRAVINLDAFPRSRNGRRVRRRRRRRRRMDLTTPRTSRRRRGVRSRSHHHLRHRLQDGGRGGRVRGAGGSHAVRDVAYGANAGWDV